MTALMYGLEPLRRDNPWPDLDGVTAEPFRLALDGGGTGGRELVVDLLKTREIELVAEIGCFLCGGCRQWLETSEHVTVIGIDPWDGNWAPYMRRLWANQTLHPNVAHLGEAAVERIAADLQAFGNFAIALNNIRDLRERFIPVRRSAPEALRYLHERQVRPDLIYIDADKTRESLDAAHRHFPEAILCGDDWLWPDADGVLIMQQHVTAFAAENGFEVRHKRQTWVLDPAPAGAARAVLSAAPAADPSAPRLMDDPAGSPQAEGMMIAQAYLLADVASGVFHAMGATPKHYRGRIRDIARLMESRPPLVGDGEAHDALRRSARRHLEALGELIVGRLEERRSKSG